MTTRTGPPGERAVFITGASDGLGAAFARRYAARGWTVGLVARRAPALQAVAAALPTRTAIYAVDVTDGEAMSAAAADFMDRFGTPEVVIANAGVSVGTLTEFPEDTETSRRVFDINVVGLIRTLQPFVEPMRAVRRGRLVGIASVAGIRGLPGAGAYCASKSAVITYLESLRVELHGTGVAVQTMCPGYVATAMTARNPYPMPFLLPVDEAAGRIVRAIDSGKRLAVIPWQMAIVATLLRGLPRPVFDRLFRNAGRKPRAPQVDEVRGASAGITRSPDP